LLYLISESILLNRRIKKIPLRISVTGTRGKSTVTRLLASILEENGKRVIAKTTGSEPCIILPDRKEMKIKRRGMVSIQEQLKFIKKATAVKAECIVTEIMSLHPDNHYVESQQIFKPNIVIITNIRRDHTEAMGESVEEIAEVFCLDIPGNAKVFLHENEYREVFQKAADQKGSVLNKIQNGVSSEILKMNPDLKIEEFKENLDIIYSAGKSLNISDEQILKGILKTKHDIGKLKIWKFKSEKGKKSNYFVNCFAANDPESTFQAVSGVQKILDQESLKNIGLLSLREDTGDRTLQWINALKGTKNIFNKVYVIGRHANIVKRKVKNKNTEVLKISSPQTITEKLLKENEDKSAIFGIGNMAGVGKTLVEFWGKTGDEYRV
jgi:poly-gamma-glutamate synthase PgsB/CapB